MFFQAQNLVTEKEVIRRVQKRGADDIVIPVEVLVKKTIKPAAYGYEDLHDGDVIYEKNSV